MKIIRKIIVKLSFLLASIAKYLSLIGLPLCVIGVAAFAANWAPTSIVGEILGMLLTIGMFLVAISVLLAVLSLLLMLLVLDFGASNDAWLAIAIGGSLIVVLLMTLPVLEYKRMELLKQRTVIPNISNIHKSFIKYTAENNDVLPAINRWCDVVIGREDGNDRLNLLQYRNIDYSCNIAFNANIGQAKLGTIPSNVIMLFEANGPWNLHGGEDLFIQRSKEANTVFILFVDGTIGEYKYSNGKLKLYTKGKAKNYLPLRWKP